MEQNEQPSTMIEHIWSKGEEYETTKRSELQKQYQELESQIKKQQEYETKMNESHDPNHIQNVVLHDQFNKTGDIIMRDTKRDGFNELIGQRQMTGQISMSPFRNNNNYIQDLDDQANFLRPKKT